MAVLAEVFLKDSVDWVGWGGGVWGVNGCAPTLSRLTMP